MEARTIVRFAIMQVSVATAFPLLWFGHVEGFWPLLVGGIILGVFVPGKPAARRLHQDWWDSDGRLLSCSDPSDHDSFCASVPSGDAGDVA